MILATVMTSALALAAGGGDPAGRELDEALDLLSRIDAVTATLDYVDTPLLDVLDDLNHRSPATIRVDWLALIRLGVGRNDPVTFKLEDGRLSTALGALMLAMGDEFERPAWDVLAGQIVITSLHATESMRLTDVLDVRDLLAAGVIRELDDWNDAAGDLDEGEGDAGADGEGESGETDSEVAARRATAMRPVMTRGEALALMLLEHVDPEAWHDFGGTLARVSDAGGVLLVSAPPRTHQRLRQVLRQLRRAYPATVAVEASVIDLPRARLDQLSRRFEPGSAALARAIIGADEAVRVWSAQLGSAPGETSLIQAESGETRMELECTPRLDAGEGLLRLGLRLDMSMDGESRSLSVTAAISSMHGAAVHELPAAGASDTARVLVLIPK